MIIKDLNLVMSFTGNSYISWKSKLPFEILIKYILPYFDKKVKIIIFTNEQWNEQ